jgi:hypothetical protein
MFLILLGILFLIQRTQSQTNLVQNPSAETYFTGNSTFANWQIGSNWGRGSGSQYGGRTGTYTFFCISPTCSQLTQSISGLSVNSIYLFTAYVRGSYATVDLSASIDTIPLLSSVSPTGANTWTMQTQSFTATSSTMTLSLSADPHGHGLTCDDISIVFSGTHAPTPNPTFQPSSQPSSYPSRKPSSQPTRQPTSHPSAQPSTRPSSQPSRQPSSKPSMQPSRQPSVQPTTRPTNQPSIQPSSDPSSRPSSQPSEHPTAQPSALPTNQPTEQPTRQPTAKPSAQPSVHPSMQPTEQPTRQPTAKPSAQPSVHPSMQPTTRPTTQPSSQPTALPTVQPNVYPSSQPSRLPTAQPTRHPSGQPSVVPTEQPTSQPTSSPSTQPSNHPSRQPTAQPSMQPSVQPSSLPTVQPSRQPSSQPYSLPSSQPSHQPTDCPSVQPSSHPSRHPSNQPTCRPSAQPSSIPSVQPSDQPTMQPTHQPLSFPTSQPSILPTVQPTSVPTIQPRSQPTTQPTVQPTVRPSSQPTSPTAQPSELPSGRPSMHPTEQPTTAPTNQPTNQPSSHPSEQPSSQPSRYPSNQPSISPSSQPSIRPSAKPTVRPTFQPSSQPSNGPSSLPTVVPSGQPTCEPSVQPTAVPSDQPSGQPTVIPSCQPSTVPTSQPSRIPSSPPTEQPSTHPTRQPSQQPSSQPVSFPTSEPSKQPTGRPSAQPTVQPSSKPSSQPTSLPSPQPTNIPSMRPTSCPSTQPSGCPSNQPSSSPTSQPSHQPTQRPTIQPTSLPSAQPTSQPSIQPTVVPTGQPSRLPSTDPSVGPTSQPSVVPTSHPTGQPSSTPSVQPSGRPSAQPSCLPSSQPSGVPSNQPTALPSQQPTECPSSQPTSLPTTQPTNLPSSQPTMVPSTQPSEKPTAVPSSQPSNFPSGQPTMFPSAQPSSKPTVQPSGFPTSQPTYLPSSQPTSQPSSQPTSHPSTQPTGNPTGQPTREPSVQPSAIPTTQPSDQPTTRPSAQPSSLPSSQPSTSPSSLPSTQPTVIPSSQPMSQPSNLPTRQPTCLPSSQPSAQPSVQPTTLPSGQPTLQPTVQPSNQPSIQPSSAPTSQPTSYPTTQPTAQPTVQPTIQPTIQPSRQPTGFPSAKPSSLPSYQPSSQPSLQPTNQPSSLPTTQPSSLPTDQPAGLPTAQPTIHPSGQPSGLPSSQPTGFPSSQPSSLPTVQPSIQPSSDPTIQPSAQPTGIPSTQPSSQPSTQPTGIPSNQPSGLPTKQPTNQPSGEPTLQPSSQPTAYPSSEPTIQPSSQPTEQPSSFPSVQPSRLPTSQPTNLPTFQPSALPSQQPTTQPTNQPSAFPSSQPTSPPTSQPSTQPSNIPSNQPTSLPSGQPSAQPTQQPSGIPSCQPSGFPSSQPSDRPTVQPSDQPTGLPSTHPTYKPTNQPTRQPSSFPTSQPTGLPSSQPSAVPSNEPSIQPSSFPSAQPSSQPTSLPSTYPSSQPSSLPTSQPSTFPSSQPSSEPSLQPSSLPTCVPSSLPSSQPSSVPTTQPSSQPSTYPSSFPTTIPSNQPTSWPSCQPSIHPTRQPSSVPSSQPSSSPSSVPSGFPTNFPTSQPSGCPTSRPSVRPSSQPSRRPSVQPVSFPTARPSAVPSTFLVLTTSPTAASISRNVYLTIAFSSVFQSSYSKDEFQIKFSPSIVSFPLKLSLQLTPNSDITTAARITPNEFDIPVSSLPLAPLTANLIAGSPGIYEVKMNINSGAYNVSYPTGNIIQILSLNTEPPVPKLQTAFFSNDGSFIILKFDAPTNRGKSYNSFICNTYFTFKNVNNSQCNWYDDSTINIYQLSSSSEIVFLNVGQNITLKAVVTLKAFCVNSADGSSCNNWKSVAQQSIIIRPALEAIAPVIQISAPRLISPCQSLSLDLTSSTGNGGRNWKSIRLVARQSPSVSDLKPLNQFLALNYSLSPPTNIPSTYFTKGTNYTFQATLCNFLDSCGGHFVQVAINDNDNSLIPYATILGSTTLNVYRKFAVQLKSSAFTVNCRGETSYQSLAYEWKIMNSKNISDPFTKSIRSISQNPSFYILPAFILSSSSSYIVQLKVTSLSSFISSSFKVQVNVLQGKLNPVISGGSYQSIQYNIPAIIDASQSYDDDQKLGSTVGMYYEWSCIPSSSLNSLATECSEFLTFPNGVTSSKLTVLPFSVFSINATFNIFLKLFDRSGRSESLSSTLKILNSQLNSISILTVQASVATFPTSNALVLTATMDIYNPCRAVWTAISISALESLSSTPTSQQVNLGIRQPFNLRILPNTLPERSSITFILTCGLSSSAVTVTTNGSPIPGEFSVNPSKGNELVTSFVFTASFWSDPDLPLTYQFGFISPSTDTNLVTQVRSAAISLSSFLPAGSDVNQNLINCSLQVFDVFNASKIISRFVTVVPLMLEEKQNAVSSFILHQSISLVGNAEAQRAFISVASTTLNSVNCSVPVNCSSLYRSPCRATPNSCGPCLSGYHGDSGDKNTLCESISRFKNFDFSGGCHTDHDCAGGLQHCVNSTCRFLPKQCPGDCSKNGPCLYKYVSTGIPLSSCTIDDLSCQAYCNCLEGFIGEDCSINQANLPQIQATRSILIHTLKNLTHFDDISKDSVQSWSSSLRSIVTNPAEISQNDISTVQEIALKTAFAASNLGLQSNSLLGVLNAMDAIATSTAQAGDHNNATAIEGTDSFLSILSQYSHLASSELVYGEEPQTIIYNNFRISTSVSLLSDFTSTNSGQNQSSLTIEVPKTDIEEILSIPKSSLQFFPSNESASASSSPISVSLIQTYEKSYTFRPSVFFSDPIQFTYRVANTSASSEQNETNNHFSSIIFRVRHNEAISGFNIDNSTTKHEEFRSNCTLGITNSTTYYCKITKMTLIHHCNGSFSGGMVSYCPLIVPTCNSINVSSSLLSSNHSSCETIGFTTSETICSCPFQGGGSTTRRRLSGSSLESLSQASGTSNLVAATEYLEKDFVQTFAAQNELGGSEGARKSQIMIAIVCFVWGGGFVLFFIISFREKYHFMAYEENKQKEKEQQMLKLPNVDTEQQNSRKTIKQKEHEELVEKIKEEIFRYIGLLIPAVYNAKESFVQRCMREIGLHHRYFHLMSMDLRRPTSLARFYKTVKILSVQTLSMFLQAVLFDLQNPQDDGSCSFNRSEESCLLRRTVLDQSQSYCQWDVNTSGCSYAPPVFSEVAVIYVMIITAICTAIFKVPMDYCLKVWICPVYEEEDFVRANQTLPFAQNELASDSLEVDKAEDRGQERNFSRNVPYLGVKPFIMSPISCFLSRFSCSSSSIKSKKIKGRAMPREVTKVHTAMNAFASKITRHSFKQAALAEMTPKTAKEGDDLEKGVDSLATISLKEKYVKELCENIIRCRLQLKANLMQQLSLQQEQESSIKRNSVLENTMWELFNDQWGILDKPSSLENSSDSSLTTGQREKDEYKNNSIDNDPVFQEILQTSLKSKDSLDIFNAFEPSAIQQYLAFARQFHENYLLSQSKLEKLNSENASIELMYVFIMDLLGQTTAAAKIFHNKFNEEYQIMMIVTRMFKILCIVFVFLLNGFFIYFLLLKSVSKGLLWQTQFLKMNLTTLLIEIFLFETIECLFLNYFIPESVNKDVYNAVYVLEIIAENLDNFILQQEKQEMNLSANLLSSANETEFDSSSYLFLSKSLILLKPHLIESFIIHSYQNHYPGMICHTWPHYQKRKKISRTRQKARDKEVAKQQEQQKSIELLSGSIKDEENNLSSTFSRRASIHPSRAVARSSRRYSRYVKTEINSADFQESDEIGDYNNSDEATTTTTNLTLRATGKFVFIILSSIAAGIYFSLQTLGILPMFSQRIVIRVLQTSILSGLTLLYYTSQEHKPYFAIFGGIVSVIVMLVIIKNAYKQYEKNKEFQNNVLKKKIERLKEKRESEKTIPSIWQSTRMQEFSHEQQQQQEKEEDEDDLETKLQLKILRKKEKKEEKRRKRLQEEEETVRTLVELDDIKYSSPSFKPVAPELYEDRDFLKSLDYLAALANADYTPLSAAPNFIPQSSAASLVHPSSSSVSLLPPRSRSSAVQPTKRMAYKEDYIHSLEAFFDDDDVCDDQSIISSSLQHYNYDANSFPLNDNDSVSQMSMAAFSSSVIGNDNHSLASAAKYYLLKSFNNNPSFGQIDTNHNWDNGDYDVFDDNISYLTNSDSIYEKYGSSSLTNDNWRTVEGEQENREIREGNESSTRNKKKKKRQKN